MARKSLKDDIRKPDIVIKTIESLFEFVRSNLRLFIIGVAVFCAAALSVYGYSIYSDKKNEKVQISIAEGAKALETYNNTGNKDELTKAETIFQKVVKERQGKAYQVAKLYLGTVYTLKGQTEDAKKLYSELSKDSPTVVRMLAQKAMANLK